MDRQSPIKQSPIKTIGGRAIALTSTLALLLAGCQNTDWGQRFGRAISPSVPTESQPPVPAAPTESTNEPTEPTESTADAPTPATAEPVDRTPQTQNNSATRFQDLDEAPEARDAIAALDALDVFDEVAGDRFAPNRSIRRGEFARWVVRANNALYADRPARQIRLGKPTDTPAFLDVPEDRPDFIYIQALGRAGLAKGDRDSTFEPDLLLSRAELIRMKAAIDALPPAQPETEARATVSQRWGFSDVDDIPANALNALIADASLGDASNVSRTFGLLRTFDAQTPITRGEAAIALTAFGSSDDRRTAAEASELSPSPKSEPSTESDPSSETPTSTRPSADPETNNTLEDSSTPTAPSTSDPESEASPVPQTDSADIDPESAPPQDSSQPESAPSAPQESTPTEPAPNTGGFITDTIAPQTTDN